MSLDPYEVHVWLAEPDTVVHPGLVQRCRAILSPEEQARYARFLVDRPRHEYLIAHALVRTALSHYAPVAPEDWQFCSSPSGKPEICGPVGVPGLRFNLSHTRGLCVCGITLERAVGVDVEPLDRPISEALQTSCVSPAEAAMLTRIPIPERARRFLELWTLKEAYLKACGLGLAVPTSAVSFQMSPDSPIRVTFGPEVTDDPARWQFFHTRLRSYSLALAFQHASERPLSVLLRPEDLLARLLQTSTGN